MSAEDVWIFMLLWWFSLLWAPPGFAVPLWLPLLSCVLFLPSVMSPSPWVFLILFRFWRFESAAITDLVTPYSSPGRTVPTWTCLVACISAAQLIPDSCFHEHEFLGVTFSSVSSICGPHVSLCQNVIPRYVVSFEIFLPLSTLLWIPFSSRKHLDACIISEVTKNVNL